MSFNPSFRSLTMLNPDLMPTRDGYQPPNPDTSHLSFFVLSAGFQSASNAPVPSREPGQLTDGLIRDHTIHGKTDNKVKARSL